MAHLKSFVKYFQHSFVFSTFMGHYNLSSQTTACKNKHIMHKYIEASIINFALAIHFALFFLEIKYW